MPISFTIIIVLLIFLFIYKNIPNVNINSVVLKTLLFMLILGFFVSEINVADRFFVNIIFLSITMFLVAEFVFKNKATKTVLSVCASIAVVVVYFIISKANSDYLSFFNYAPITLLVILTSLFFVKNIMNGFIYIIFSYFLIETLNYIMFSNSIGVLRLFSVGYINAVIISLVAFYFASFLFNLIFNKKKNNNLQLNEVEGVMYDEK